MEQLLVGNHLEAIGVALASREPSFLVILDSERCKHSLRFLQELTILAMFHQKTPKTRVTTVFLLDLGKRKSVKDLVEVDKPTWLLGVPCVVTPTHVHFGVDAFHRCKELCTAAEALLLETSWPDLSKK